MKNVQTLVPEPIVESCLVTPRGAAKAIMTGAVVGAAGSAAKAANDTIASHRESGSPLRAGAASLGLLALTDHEVVLLDGRRGMLKPVATGVAGRAPRAGIVSAELGSGKLSTPLRLSWADGTAWELEIPRSDLKKARALVDRVAA